MQLQLRAAGAVHHKITIFEKSIFRMLGLQSSAIVIKVSFSDSANSIEKKYDRNKKSDFIYTQMTISSQIVHSQNGTRLSFCLCQTERWFTIWTNFRAHVRVPYGIHIQLLPHRFKPITYILLCYMKWKVEKPIKNWNWRIEKEKHFSVDFRFLNEKCVFSWNISTATAPYKWI